MQHSAPVSEMDVSHAEGGGGNDAGEGGGGNDAGVDPGAELGYQGWAARRLVLGCHRIFVEHGGGGGGGIDAQQQPVESKDLVSESLEHRGVIYWCLANINGDVASAAPAAAPSEADLRDEDVFHDGLTDFYHVWTLAEAFLLDSAPLPAAPLLRWLKMYSQSGEDEAARWELDEAERVALEADAAGGSADPNPAYWDALRSLVVGVTPRRAAEMLRSHPEGRDNAGEVGALARQLEKMPLLLPEGTDGGDAAAAGDGGGLLDREGFFETWTRWQKGCKAAAARFGVVVGVGVDRGSGSGGGGEEERRQLRWLWGTLCGERNCLEEGSKSWSGLFAAVLAFERPDTRKEEVAPVMRECLRKYKEHPEESFLTRVIRDASAGAVDSILKFAHEHGDTLALSACATHLVDLLSRAELTSVTNQQRSWFFRRLADRLKAFPCGGWELAAAYLSGGRDGGGHKNDGYGGGHDDDVEAQLLRDLARGVVPGSERATHELVGWCRTNNLREETAAAVCRARGVAWLGQTGFSAAAMGTAMGTATVMGEVGAAESGQEKGDAAARVAGACGRAAYWLAKAGGGVQLERLCAEVSERLMVEVSPRSGGAAGVEAHQAVLAEANGVLAAIPPGVAGPELSFLERYKEIAELLSAEAPRPSLSSQHLQQHQAGVRGGEGGGSLALGGPNARRAGALAVEMLAPRGGDGFTAAALSDPAPTLPPPRSWAHLLRLSVPALAATATAAAATEEGGGEMEEDAAPVTAAQVHALLAKLQALVASERRVGSVRGVGHRSWGCYSGSTSTLASAPAPYGFRGGGGGSSARGGGEEEVSEIRCALARCLGAAMMAQNAKEAAPLGDLGGGRKRLAGRPQSGMRLLGTNKLPAEALIAPRVAV